MRTCTNCKNTMDDEAFELVTLKGKQHRRGRCRECNNAYRRAQRRADPEKYARQSKAHWERKGRETFRRKYAANAGAIRAAAKAHRDTPQGRAYYLWKNARNRSGPDFNLSRERILQKILAGRCERSGLPFNPSASTGSGMMNSFAPSLDKIDRTKGYVEGNVQVVVWCYNSGKGVMTDEQFLAFCKAVVAHNA